MSLAVTTIAEWCDDYGGYEWAEIHVYRREDGALAVDGDSGCSCNSYEEPSELVWRHDATSFYVDVANELAASAFFSPALVAEKNAEARKIWKESRAL